MGYHSIMMTITNTTPEAPGPAHYSCLQGSRAAPHGQPDRTRLYPTDFREAHYASSTQTGQNRTKTDTFFARINGRPNNSRQYLTDFRKYHYTANMQTRTK